VRAPHFGSLLWRNVRSFGFANGQLEPSLVPLPAALTGFFGIQHNGDLCRGRDAGVPA